MKYSRFLCLALLAGLSLYSCKKDDETSSLPSLTGLSIAHDATTYVGVGAKLIFTADISAVATSDDTDPGQIGMYWQVNTAARDTLTLDIHASLPSYPVNVDTLGTYNVYCSIFATDYYTNSTSSTFKAIDPDTALTGLVGEHKELVGGKSLLTVEAGDHVWLAENYYSDGTPYMGSEVLDSVFGHFYTWEKARTACPEGWRLPTGAEFDALGPYAGSLMANAVFLTEEMWEYRPDVTVTNETGFNALPLGYIDFTEPQQSNQGFKQYALWWTADEVNADLASFRFIHNGDPALQQGQGSKTSLALNVRCIKN